MQLSFLSFRQTLGWVAILCALALLLVTRGYMVEGVLWQFSNPSKSGDWGLRLGQYQIVEFIFVVPSIIALGLAWLFFGGFKERWPKVALKAYFVLIAIAVISHIAMPFIVAPYRT